MKTENCINIVIDEKNYNCHRRLNSSFEGYEGINKRIDMLENKISSMAFATLKKPLKYAIYYCDDNDVNAFAHKIEGGVYAIVLFKGLFFLENEIEEYFEDELLQKFFCEEPKTPKQYAHIIQKNIILFVTLHELFHILNGHLMSEDFCASKIGERPIRTDYSDMTFRHIIECNADWCAIRSSLYFIYGKYNEEIRRKQEMLMLFFSVYFVFLKFQEQAYETWSCINDLETGTHPVASIRAAYAITAFNNYMLNEKFSEMYVAIFDSCINKICMYFEEKYYEADSLKTSLLSLAYTEPGCIHMDKINNGWNEVREALKKYAFIDLRKNDRSRFIDNYWVSNDGKFIKDRMREKIGLDNIDEKYKSQYV